MQRSLIQGVPGAVLVLATACSSAARDHSVAATAPADSPTRTVGIVDPGSSPPIDEPAPLPGGAGEILGLDRALLLALRSNPDLSLQSSRRDAAAGQIEQASVRPSPVAALEVEDVLGTGQYHGAVVNQTTLYLNQQIELGGKRSRRMAVAEGRSHALSQLHEVERVEVLRSTAHAFLQVARAQGELRFTEELLQMQKGLEAAQAEQIRAGRTPESEVERSRAAVALAQVQRTQARGELERARRELALHFGEVELRFEEVAPPGEVSLELPDLAQLEDRLVRNALIKLEDARVVLSAASVDNERAIQVPDLEVSVGLRRFEEDSDLAFTFGLSIPLTITNANRGNMLTAEAERREAQRRRLLIGDRLLTSLVLTHGSLANALEEVRTLEEDVIPAAEQSYVHSEEGYRLGRFSYLELREAQDTLIAARRQLSDARIRFHEAWIDLQALTDDFAIGDQP